MQTSYISGTSLCCDFHGKQFLKPQTNSKECYIQKNVTCDVVFYTVMSPKESVKGEYGVK